MHFKTIVESIAIAAIGIFAGAGLAMIGGGGITTVSVTVAVIVAVIITTGFGVVSLALRSRSLLILKSLLNALCLASTFLLGALAAGFSEAGVIAWALFSPILFARDILKSIEHAESPAADGDVHGGSSRPGAIEMRIGGVVMLITALATPLPYYLQFLGWQYLLVILPLFALPLAYWAGGALAFPKQVRVGSVRSGLLLASTAGLLALAIGYWTR